MADGPPPVPPPVEETPPEEPAPEAEAEAEAEEEAEEAEEEGDAGPDDPQLLVNEHVWSCQLPFRGCETCKQAFAPKKEGVSAATLHSRAASVR